MAFFLVFQGRFRIGKFDGYQNEKSLKMFIFGEKYFGLLYHWSSEFRFVYDCEAIKTHNFLL